MKLHDFIELGIKTTGSGAELSRRLDMLYNNFQSAKAEKRGLPSHACVKLAEIIAVDPLEVIAASEMVTEKKPERQALWKRVLEHRHAAAVVCCFALISGFFTPETAQAKTLLESTAYKHANCKVTHSINYTQLRSGPANLDTWVSGYLL